MIKAYGKSIVVSPEDGVTKSSSGALWLPETTKKIKQTGLVLSVGNKVDLGIKAGDRVAYEPGAGRIIRMNNENILILDKSELLGVEERTSLLPLVTVAIFFLLNIFRRLV